MTAIDFIEELKQQIPALNEYSQEEIDVGFFLDDEFDDDDYDKIEGKAQSFNRKLLKGNVTLILLKSPIVDLSNAPTTYTVKGSSTVNGKSVQITITEVESVAIRTLLVEKLDLDGNIAKYRFIVELIDGNSFELV